MPKKRKSSRIDITPPPVPEWVPLDQIERRMDEDGDLLLRVGSALGKEHEFKVCSAALRRASPVWKAMLFSKFKEAKPADGSEWIVELPEDDPSPLAIILQIIHGKFELVPTYIPLAQLYGLLILTDKYQMTHVVKPWAHTWVEVVRQPRPTVPEYPGNDSVFDGSGDLTGHGRILRMYAAWELGWDDQVSVDIVNLVFNSQFPTSDSGAEVKVCYGDKSLALENQFGPLDVVGMVINPSTHPTWV